MCKQFNFLNSNDELCSLGISFINHFVLKTMTLNSQDKVTELGYMAALEEYY